MAQRKSIFIIPPEITCPNCNHTASWREFIFSYVSSDASYGDDDGINCSCYAEQEWECPVCGAR